MKRTLACFGLAFAGAELFAAYLPLWVTVPAAALFAVLLAVLWRSPRFALRPVLLGALAGLCWFGVYTLAVVLPAQHWAGQTVRRTVVVQTDCETSYRDGELRGSLRITQVEGKPVNLRVYCSAFPGREPGECFTADFALAALEQNAYRMTRQARGIYLQAEYLGDCQTLPPSTAPVFALYRLRQTLSRTVRSWLPRSLGGLEAAMLLGDKAALGDTENEIFRAAGVSHLLAVSGLHVALLCGLLSFGQGRRRKFYRPFILLQAGVVVFYMLLTGLPVSVLRAGLVFLLALLGNAFLQPVDLLTSTGAAAILMGLQNAYAPCDVGFQLSFAAVLGVQCAAALGRWQQRRFAVAEPETIRQRAANALLAGLSAVQVAAFASLATLPVLIAHGLTTSGVGVLTNLLVVWMLQPALLLGLLVLALAALPFLAPVMHMASLVLAVWLKIMLGLVTWCAALPAARLYLPPRYTLFVLAVLGLLALLFWAKRRMVWYLPAAALCTAVAVALGVWMERDVVRVALVGTAGNPCVVCTQNGQAAVVFRGGAGNERAVTEYLADHGAPELCLLVDLRQSPEQTTLPAAQTLMVAGLEGLAQYTILDSVALDLYHNSSGNLAVLGVGQYHIGAMAGNIKLAQPLQLDVFCAAGALSDSVQAQTILYTAKTPKWKADAAGLRLLYGEDTPTITLRPNRSMIFEEVRTVAVQ